MKNSTDLRGCYPPRTSASVDNTLLDLQNSSYATQPHSIIAKYVKIIIGNSKSLIWGKIIIVVNMFLFKLTELNEINYVHLF